MDMLVFPLRLCAFVAQVCLLGLGLLHAMRLMQHADAVFQLCNAIWLLEHGRWHVITELG